MQRACCGWTAPGLYPMARQTAQRYRAYHPTMGCQSCAHTTVSSPRALTASGHATDRPYSHPVTAVPFVDEHIVRVRAPLARTWDAVTKLARRLAERPAPRAFVALWQLEPATGFAIASSSAPERIALVGHHRFARYELAFELHPAAEGVELRARTSAEFPGAAGRLYRALVIGSGGHAIAVRAMLRQIRRAAERTAPQVA